MVAGSSVADQVLHIQKVRQRDWEKLAPAFRGGGGETHRRGV